MKNASFLILSVILAFGHLQAEDPPTLEDALLPGMVEEAMMAEQALLARNALMAEGERPALTSITTVDGVVYDGVKVLKHDPDGLFFRHAKGMAKIPFADLPAEVQRRFGYAPEAAAAFVKEHEDAARAAREKAEAAQAAARERKAEEKAMRFQLELMRLQAVSGGGGGGGVILPGYGDFGVATWGYGLGLGLGSGRRGAQWDRDRLFPDYFTDQRIGPNAALYDGAVTNSNVRPMQTFGGYRYPTALAVRADAGVGSARRAGSGGGGWGVSRAPARGRLVPAISGGSRIGGTGTLMQTGGNRISHR